MNEAHAGSITVEYPSMIENTEGHDEPIHFQRDHAEEVRMQAANARHYTECRDAAIRQMRTAGESLRAIGRAAGLSHTAIKKIIDRGES